MSSDSELSTFTPDDATLEKALRNAVVQAQKAGTLHETSTNKIRDAAEQELGLDSGFFKSHSEWKDKSKDVIKHALDTLEDVGETAQEPKPKSKANDSKSGTRKRALENPKPKPKKRQKREVSDEEVLSDPPEETRPSPQANGKKAKGSRTSKPIIDVFEDEENVEAKDDEESEIKDQANASESEMSDVIDEPQPAKKRRKDEGSSTTRKADKAKTKAKPTKQTKEQDLSPDEAEMKRLQGWLLKCGIRKRWFRELAPYDSSKAKIKHLKDLLKDAGMDGRYSAEKASAIKEQRELAADLEAVQEGNKTWGKEGEDDNDKVVSKRRRSSNRVVEAGSEEDEAEEDQVETKRKTVASRFIDFGDDDDDEDD